MHLLDATPVPLSIAGLIVATVALCVSIYAAWNSRKSANAAEKSSNAAGRSASAAELSAVTADNALSFNKAQAELAAKGRELAKQIEDAKSILAQAHELDTALARYTGEGRAGDDKEGAVKHKDYMRGQLERTIGNMQATIGRIEITKELEPAHAHTVASERSHLERHRNDLLRLNDPSQNFRSSLYF